MISEDPLAARENVEIAAPTSFDLSFATFCRETEATGLSAPIVRFATICRETARAGARRCGFFVVKRAALNVTCALGGCTSSGLSSGSYLSRLGVARRQLLEEL